MHLEHRVSILVVLILCTFTILPFRVAAQAISNRADTINVADSTLEEKCSARYEKKAGKVLLLALENDIDSQCFSMLHLSFASYMTADVNNLVRESSGNDADTIQYADLDYVSKKWCLDAHMVLAKDGGCDSINGFDDLVEYYALYKVIFESYMRPSLSKTKSQFDAYISDLKNERIRLKAILDIRLR